MLAKIINTHLRPMFRTQGFLVLGLRVNVTFFNPNANPVKGHFVLKYSFELQYSWVSSAQNDFNMEGNSSVHISSKSMYLSYFADFCISKGRSSNIQYFIFCKKVKGMLRIY